MIMSFIAMFLEFIEAWHSGSFKNYFTSIHNMMDFIIIAAQIVYSFERIVNPSHKILPEEYVDNLVPSEKLDDIVLWSLANIAMTILHIQQVYKYMRVHEDFGNIVELSLSILNKVKYFMMFFLLWVSIFALFYGMLGNTIDKDEDHAEDG